MQPLFMRSGLADSQSKLSSWDIIAQAPATTEEGEDRSLVTSSLGKWGRKRTRGGESKGLIRIWRDDWKYCLSGESGASEDSLELINRKPEN